MITLYENYIDTGDYYLILHEKVKIFLGEVSKLFSLDFSYEYKEIRIHKNSYNKLSNNLFRFYRMTNDIYFLESAHSNKIKEYIDEMLSLERYCYNQLTKHIKLDKYDKDVPIYFNILELPKLKGIEFSIEEFKIFLETEKYNL